MFILLVIALTFISIALRVIIFSLNTTVKLVERREKIKDRNPEKGSALPSSVGKIATVTTKAVIRFLKLMKRVVSVTRNLLAMIGSLVIIVDIIILIVLAVVAAGFLLLFNKTGQA